MRESISSFNPDSSNIGVTYCADNLKQDPRLSVFIYPASPNDEFRLYNEYFNCLQGVSIASGEELDAVQKPIAISKDGYKLLGIRGTIRAKTFKSVLMLFECGKYFIKYRITSSSMDTSQLNSISTKLIDRFSPADIVKKQPLYIKYNIHIAPACMKDSISRSPILSAVFTKIKWINQNVDSLQRISGFPGLYFDEQKTSITAMLKRWDERKYSNTSHGNPDLEKYYDDLSFIRDNGFLNEYIYTQFNCVLVLPPDVKLNLEGFNKWCVKNKPTVSITGPSFYYFVYYLDSDSETKND
jgi:hypothetical protein